jgi:Family of unknown function (DUF6350)
VVSLLARLPRPGRAAEDRRRALPGPVLAALAAAAVPLVAVVGLGLALVVVQTLDPAGGLSVGGCAALAGRLVVLAAGGGLRTSGGPLVLAPLLLTLGLAWGLARGVRAVVHARELTAAGAVARVAGAAALAALAVLLAVAAAADGPGARIGWGRTAAGAVVLTAVSCGWGALRESGGGQAVLDRWPAVLRPVPRAVLVGLLTALALCLTVVAVAVASDAAGYAALSGSLGGAAAGALGLLGLEVLLLPNAAAAVLGLAAGPGFAVGSATLVSVHGVTLGAVPALPLLAALPDTQAVPLIAFASQAVPALAGLVAGATVGRRLGPEDGGSLLAALSGLVSGVGLGAAAAALTAVGGGSLGTGALAHVGAPALATGVAVAAQSAVAAALAAAVVRWRSRG